MVGPWEPMVSEYTGGSSRSVATAVEFMGPIVADGHRFDK